jgi:uncharacterized membrane protein (DUF4010 family)
VADGHDTRTDLLPALQSPFSPSAVFKFGLLFLGLEVAGALAQRVLGSLGFYAVTVIGGMVSSASAVASAASLATSHKLTADVAGIGAVLASLASAFVNFPILIRVGQSPPLARSVGTVLSMTVLLGLLGVLISVVLFS